MLYPRVNAVLLYIVTVCRVADCKTDYDGLDYDGHITKKGDPPFICVAWNTDKTYTARWKNITVTHKFHEEDASSFVHSSSNYCRNKRNPRINPGNDGGQSGSGPWCLYERQGYLRYTFCSDSKNPHRIPLCGQYTRCLKLFIYYLSLILDKVCRKVGLIIYTVSKKTSPCI